MRAIRWLLIVAVVLQGFTPALAYAQGENPPRSAPQAAAQETSAPDLQNAIQSSPSDQGPVYAPADVPNGVAVTITVDPAEIAAGEAIVVSGQGAPASAKIRLATVSDGMTLGIEDVTAGGDGVYTAEVPVDAAYPTGDVQICALVVGVENAAVTCTTLRITPPANGSLSGRLPLDGVSSAGAEAIDAQFQLMNASGAVRYTTPLAADGSFSLADVAPGPYLYAVIGSVPKLADLGSLTVQPKKDGFLELAIHKSCTLTSLLKPTTALNVNPSRVEFTHKSRNFGLFRTYEDVRRPFGIYVTGVKNDVTFTASPQATGQIDNVIFEFYGVNGQVIQRLDDNTAPYSVVFDVGRLPANKGELLPWVSITPVVGGQNQCPSLYDFDVMGNPMSTPYMQPLPYSRTIWDGASRTYQFEGVLPYVEDLLPAHYSLGTVPFLGEIKNEFNTGVYVKGYFDLEGKARIFLTEVFADAVLLSLPILPPGQLRENITPPGLGLAEFDIRNPSHISIPYGPLELFQKDIISVPFVKILVFTYFGIVNAYVSGGLTFGVGLYLEGEVRPLAPALDSTLTGAASLSAELGLSADILLGIVEGGGGLGGEICAGLPLRAVLSDVPDVYFDNPYVGGRLYLVLWASAVWGLVKTRTTKDLTDFGRGCPGAAAAIVQSEPPAPDVFRSPAIAASLDGRMLAAYVENTAAPGATPQVQILARLQDSVTPAWSDPVAISDPAHSAQSPAVAFIGANHTPMVVWTENTLTAAEAAALGDDDPAAHMRHQEIFYALWNDGWGTPIRLTNDALPDGLPEAAGTDLGAVIAWTTDLDGDANTRGDQRIAVSTYDPNTGLFGAPSMLGFPEPGLDNVVLNNDVAVAIDEFGYAYVAWVYDLDADLRTGDDRHLAVVYGNNGDWEFLNTNTLPARVDSPTITVSSAGLQMAFLVRQPTPDDGEVGVLGTNGELWTALYINGDWSRNPMHDDIGNSIFAEQPKLDHGVDESLLVFRRFDDRTKRGALGQISVSRFYDVEPNMPPLSLTDAPNQQWLPAIAINPVDSRAVVLHSALAVSAAMSAQTMAEPLAAGQALPAVQAGALSDSANPVLFLTLEDAADPALDPLRVSIAAPAPGASIGITATVRNVGRKDTSDVTVSLYAGTSAAGNLLDSKSVPNTLEFNATSTLQFSLVVPATLGAGGQLPLYAELVTSGENITTTNDSATLSLGGLSTPSRVAMVGANPDFAGALDMIWSGNAGEYVTGYRILRADTPAGPWTLVGESAVPSFTETMATTGRAYCYAVQAYNAQGARSLPGPATCAAGVPPAVTAPGGQNAIEGKAKSFEMGSFTDPNPGGSWDVSVDWSDGPADAFSATATGSLGNRSHTYATSGRYTVTVTVTAKDGSMGAASFSVTVNAESASNNDVYLPSVLR
ncbi:MAG: PKD domain-containing protein [Caldilineaceae bacterium]